LQLKTAELLLLTGLCRYTVQLTLKDVLRATSNGGVSLQQQQPQTLPPPISPLAAAEAGLDPFCAESAFLQQFATNSSGWTWEAAKDRFKCPHPNCYTYGFHSFGTNSTLQLTIDTQNSTRADGSTQIDNLSLVGIFLAGKSYARDWASRMGLAQLSCMSGCSCEPVLMQPVKNATGGEDFSGNLAFAKTQVSGTGGWVVRHFGRGGWAVLEHALWRRSKTSRCGHERCREPRWVLQTRAFVRHQGAPIHTHIHVHHGHVCQLGRLLAANWCTDTANCWLHKQLSTLHKQLLQVYTACGCCHSFLVLAAAAAVHCMPLLLQHRRLITCFLGSALAPLQVTPHPVCVVKVTIIGSGATATAQEFFFNGIAVVPYARMQPLSPIDKRAIRAYAAISAT
jgi:hypothetical protein